MWLTKIFTAVMVALTGLLPSSCTKAKTSAVTTPAPVVTIATSSENFTNKDLGSLELTNRYETCVNLGAGKSCTIKPERLDRSNLQLTMALECKGTDGKVKGLSVVQVVAKKGKPFEVAVGDMTLTLIPMMAEQ